MQNILRTVTRRLHDSQNNLFEKPETYFILFAIIFGVFFIKVTPPLWGIDEIEHFSRAYQVSDFKFGVYKVDKSYGGSIPADIVRLGQYAKGDLVDNQNANRITQRTDLNHINEYRYLLNRHINTSPEVETTFQNTAAYSPLSYLPASFAIGIARICNMSIGATILFARMAGLFAWIVLVCMAFRLLSKHQKWFLFVVALLPMSLYQASIVNNDTVLNGLCFLLFATLVWLYNNSRRLRVKNIGRKETAIIAILVTAVSLTKPSYAILALTLLLIPGSLFVSKRSELNAKLIWVACIVLSCLLWALVSAPVSQTIGQLRGSDIAIQISPGKQIENSLSNPTVPILALLRTITLGSDGIVGSYAGVLGWNYIGMPLFAVVYTYVLLAIAGIYGFGGEAKKNHPRVYWGIIWLSVTSALSIFGILYLSFSTVGEPYVAGVQGRYFIPIIPFLIFGLIKLSGIKIDLNDKLALRLFGASIFVLLLTVSVSYTLATY